MPSTPCIRCGRLVPTGRSYCPEHDPKRPSPSSSLGRVPHLRAKAKRRDGNRCIVCGSTDRLRVHHVQAVAELGTAANTLGNLATLCETCHDRIHGVRRRRRPPAGS